MPKADYQQASFVGGEVSPLAQGRADQPWYRQALALSLNGVTIEEGAWVRRSGTKFIVPTRGRTYAKLISFDGSATCSFAMAFTDDNLQFVTQGSLIFDNTIGTISDSSYSPTGVDGVSITLSGSPAETWSQGDQVMLVFPDVTSSLYPYPQNLEAGLRNRLLTLGPVTDQTHFTLYDDVGLPLNTDGTLPSFPTGALVGAQIMRVLNLTTTYSTEPVLAGLRAVQIEYQSIILSTGVAPQVVQVTTQGTLTTDPTFTFSALEFVDGPYLDPSGDTGTVSALTGTITFTATSTTPFTASTDVGRHLRLFSQPALFNGATTYSAGDNVTDTSGAWWTSLVGSNTGNIPGQPATINGVQQLVWAPAPQAGSWAWGKITAVGSTNSATVALDTSIPNMVLQSGNGTTITLFQLGVYSNTPTSGSITPCYPTCGLWAQGRLFLGGAIQNRFDTTVSNGVNQGVATFSPTDPWDNVLDDSGISEVFNSTYTNQIQWFKEEEAGVLAGTLGGEFLIFSSQTNDPLTPTSIDSRLVTKFGSTGIEPVRAGAATIFVQKFGRRVIEYLADAFSGKYSGRHLNEYSKHLTTSGVVLIAYQEEPFPCVWTLMNNGFLAGCTYRRFSRFISEPATMAAWHRVMHGAQRTFTSMCVAPGKDGLLDRLFLITNDAAGPNQQIVNNYFIEILQPQFDEGNSVLEGWFCDEAAGGGPGNSGYDCGGGNATIFSPTGAMFGSDFSTADVSNTFPFSDNGAIPAVGDDMSGALQARAATYFDGTVALYMLPPYPSAASPADETSLSISVWVANEDYPLQAGALFSSPALTVAEANAETTIVSSILTAGHGVQDWEEGSSDGSGVVISTSGIDASPHAPAVVADNGALAANQVWNNALISVKSNGDGTVSVIFYVNETEISATVLEDNMAYHGAMWPFSSQPGGQKDGLGTCVWCIGGTAAASNAYTKTIKYGLNTPSLLTIPTVSQLIQALLGTGVPNGAYPSWVNVGTTPGTIKSGPGSVPVVASYIQYLQSKNAQLAAQARQPVTTGVTYSGGQGNLPVDNPDGSVSGYRGSVAELLVWPGQYIDWTSSTNRNLVHKFNSVTEQYVPVSLGHDGAGTALGAPYVYLSGSKDVFSINRATGKNLVLTGDGLLDSPLDPP